VKEEAKRTDKATKKAEYDDSKKAVKKVKDSQEKTTLGDYSALSDLKDKLDGKK
jgi:small subunit ribosomal protein S1